MCEIFRKQSASILMKPFMPADIHRRSFLKSSIAAAGFAPILSLVAEQPDVITDTNPLAEDGRAWWFQARYGMFVHWGLYSIHG